MTSWVSLCLAGKGGTRSRSVVSHGGDDDDHSTASISTLASGGDLAADQAVTTAFERCVGDLYERRCD